MADGSYRSILARTGLSAFLGIKELHMLVSMIHTPTTPKTSKKHREKVLGETESDGFGRWFIQIDIS